MNGLRVLLLPFLVSGCVQPPGVPSGTGGELIVIETDAGFCNGACDWFEVSAASSGRGLLRVHHNSETTRLRSFRLTAEQYRTFRDRLAPYRRPTDRFFTEPEACEQFATDLGGYHVQWRGIGSKALLVVNDGCTGREPNAARAAVRAALADLRLGRLLNPSGGVAASTQMK